MLFLHTYTNRVAFYDFVYTNKRKAMSKEISTNRDVDKNYNRLTWLDACKIESEIHLYNRQ